jgi:hypothetical protein
VSSRSTTCDPRRRCASRSRPGSPRATRAPLERAARAVREAPLRRAGRPCRPHRPRVRSRTAPLPARSCRGGRCGCARSCSRSRPQAEDRRPSSQSHRAAPQSSSRRSAGSAGGACGARSRSRSSAAARPPGGARSDASRRAPACRTRARSRGRILDSDRRSRRPRPPARAFDPTPGDQADRPPCAASPWPWPEPPPGAAGVLPVDPTMEALSYCASSHGSAPQACVPAPRVAR